MADVGISVELTGAQGVAQGLGKINQSAQQLGATAANQSKSVKSLGDSFASLKTAIVGLGALQAFSYFQKLEQGMEDSARAADRLHISFEKLQGMELIAKRAGVATQTVSQSLQQLAKSAGEAVANPLATQTRIFNALGVSSGFLKGHLNDTGAILRKTVEGINQLGSSSEKTRAISALFGDQAVQLFDLFGRGNQSVDALIKHFKDMGAIISDRAAPSLRDLNSDFVDATDRIEGFFKKVIVGGMWMADDFSRYLTQMGSDLETFFGVGERAARQREINSASRNADRGTTQWDWSRLSLVHIPAPTIAAPAPQFEDLSAGMKANFSDRSKRSLAGVLDQQALAEMQKTKMVLAELKIQYDQLSSGIQGFNQRTVVETALLHLGKNATLENRHAVFQWGQNLAEAAAKQDALNQKIARNNALIDFGIELYQSTRTPLEQYAIGLAKLNDWYDKNKGKTDLYERGLQQLKDQLAATDKVSQDFGNTLSQGMEDALFSGQKLWKVVQGMARDLGRSVFRNVFAQPVSNAVSRSISNATGGITDRASRALERGLEHTFDTFLSGLDDIFSPLLKGLGDIFSGAFKYLGDVLAPWAKGLGDILWQFLGELGIMHALHEAGLWAISLWDVAQKWAIAIFEAAASLFGFAGGGDMTVTRPTLIMVGERGAERVRVSPLAGRNAAGSSPGDGGMIGGGGGAAVNVFIPQSSVVSNITAGNFARQVARTVNRQNGRTV